MRDITPGDDVAAIGQAVFRRYKDRLKKNLPLPEVLLIDGGRTQMKAAMDSLEKLEIDSILVLGISKGAARKAGMERIFVADQQLLQLNPHDPSFHLLQAIRDEAHRFSLKTHRKKRQKNSIHSVLDDIEGIGPKKRQALLTYFGGLKVMRRASVTEIMRVPGISEALAEKIRNHLLQVG
jgi:excinuclease ABC subunit C